MTSPVRLALEPAFSIGPLEIYPPTHEVGRDGEKIIVEPRVMQVLIALARAEGAVVTRDDLILRCWDGRVVGDDAIHRILSRLRRLSEGIARDVFRIETITKVGYRLVRTAASPAGAGQSPPFPDDGDSRRETLAHLPWRADRRAVIALAGAGAVLAAGGFWLAGTRRHPEPTEVQALVARARESLREGTLDQTASAVSLLRKAVEIAPDDAEPWGALALAYQEQAVRSGSAARARLEARCQAAAGRALGLDRGNGDAAAALATLRPFYKRWAEYETDCRRALTAHPGHGALNQSYGHFLEHVGRARAAIAPLDRAMTSDPLSPNLQWQRIVALWSAGRLDEADVAMDRAIGLWPRHYAVWFVRVRVLAYTGRAKAALAMIGDSDNRPIGIPDWNFELSATEARALDSRAPVDVEAAVAAHRHAAGQGIGFAENAIIFAAAMGRIEEALTIAQGYFFDRGFAVGEQRFAREQGMQISRSQRFTAFLFSPPTAALRADPRFGALVREIGLESYWQRTGAQPDYRQS
jgi:DNA-binding winged helix-turn-helix (wHTH) protein/Tfp pilus assembly protein PilF